MIDYEQFEKHKLIIDWMVSLGFEAAEAMVLISYAENNEKSISSAYVDIYSKRST